MRIGDPLPSEERSRRSRPCNWYPPGPAGSGCVSWRVAVCGRLADGFRPGDYRISWANCGPDGVTDDGIKAGGWLTVREHLPGACSVRSPCRIGASET